MNLSNTTPDIDIRMIPVANIEWPKSSKKDRTHDDDFVSKLALSIEVEGLHQPIKVRPAPDSPDKFVGVFGRHRTAAHKHLKRTHIPAIVSTDMDDDDAQAASDSENLLRNELSEAQKARATGRWIDYYDRMRIARDAAIAAKKAAEKRPVGRPKSKPAEGPTQVVEAPEAAEASADVAAEAPAAPFEAPAELPPAPPKNIAAHVASITGESETSVRRSMAIRKAFTDDQLEVFEQCGTSKEWMETIAKVEAGAKRDGVVNLVASGMEPVEAIAQVTGAPEVKSAAGRTYEVAVVPEGAAKTEEEMTDEEWVIFHCAETLKLLADTTAFYAHAILYRTIRECRQVFKSKTRKAMEKARSENLTAGLYGALWRVVNISHPKHWLRCGTCSGTGFVTKPGDPTQKKCPECKGNAFAVKMEAN